MFGVFGGGYDRELIREEREERRILKAEERALAAQQYRTEEVIALEQQGVDPFTATAIADQNIPIGRPVAEIGRQIFAGAYGYNNGGMPQPGQAFVPGFGAELELRREERELRLEERELRLEERELRRQEGYGGGFVGFSGGFSGEPHHHKHHHHGERYERLTF